MKFYIISPPTENINFNPHNFELISDQIKVDYFQFRPKFSSLAERLIFVEKYFNDFYEICKKKQIKIIINDDFEIAKKFLFDGIHLGQMDRSCSEAKQSFGENFHIGISCKSSIKMYNDAKNSGAKYVAFGPTYKSSTKNHKTIDLKKLSNLTNSVTLPITLIGGIKHSNFLKLDKFKPDNIAIIDSLWNFKDGPIKSAELFKKKLIGR